MGCLISFKVAPDLKSLRNPAYVHHKNIKTEMDKTYWKTAEIYRRLQQQHGLCGTCLEFTTGQDRLKHEGWRRIINKVKAHLTCNNEEEKKKL